MLRTFKRLFSRATMTLALMMLTTVTAWAETETVSYIDAAGNTQSVTATVLTSGVTTIPAGWCVVKGNINFNQPIQLMGDVNLILADGASMIMGSNENRVGAHAIYGGRGSLVASGGTDYGLRIYGQSEQTGVIDIWGTTNSTSYACIKVRDLFVYGGNISLRGCNGISTRGQFDGYVNLYRGTVNITTSKNTGKGINSYFFRMFGGTLNINGLGEKAIYSNKFSMSGGTLSVFDYGNIANSDDASSTFEMTGGHLYVNGTKKGIYANTVTLGLTQDDDLIEVNNYYGSDVKVATGKVMMDATNPESPIYYMGTLNVDQKAAIAGKVIKAARFKGTGAADDPYMIYTAAGWNTFCDMLASDDVAKYDFSGKYVKLGNDITVTTMAGIADGNNDHPFKGHFDGDGHTMTVNYAITEQGYAAPFRYVDGATIQNLNVEGSIDASEYRAGGIVGHTYSNQSIITNCRVSATVSGGDHTGGISSGGNVEVNHCVFNGKITGNAKSGGLVGESSNNLSISNSLFDPQSESTCGKTLYVPYDNQNPGISNSYYTSLAGGAAQGNLAHTITADALANMTLTGSVGVQFGSTGYAKCGEKEQGIVTVTPETISLTLSDPGTAPTGYTTSDYVATAGTLTHGEGTSYTLTMPYTNENVEISAFAPIEYSITYHEGEGATFSTTRTRYTIETEDIVLDIPTKDGSRFLGWYTNEGLTEGPVTTIPHGSTGAKEFWASWEAIVNPANKDLGRCTAYVPDQNLGNYTKIWYKFEAANYPSNGVVIGEEVKDGETPLTLGTDYVFNTTLAYADPTKPAYMTVDKDQPGDELVVTIEGRGAYAGTSITATFKIIDTAEGEWGDLKWRFENRTLSITLKDTEGGNKPMNATNSEGYPWYPFASYITTISIGNGVLNVADNAFAGTSNENPYAGVTSVSLPSTLTGYKDNENNDIPAIGDYAFSYCTGATITIPSCATTFGTTPFNLVGCVIGTLSDTGDNSDLIDAMYLSKSANITLAGRTLYKDGAWNTLCLPFDMTNAQVTAQLAGCKLMELDKDGFYDANKVRYTYIENEGKYYHDQTEYSGNDPLHQTGLDGTTLNLYFKDATSIEAGKPYIIKWASGDDITSLTFNGVKIDATAPAEVTSEDSKVSFKGTYAPIEWTSEDKSILLLGVGKNNQDQDVSTLYYPKPSGGKNPGLNAFRAYFQLNNGQQASAFNLNFDDNDATGIVEMRNEEIGMRNGNDEMSNAGWYTLSGTRLSAKPTQPGLYINNGRKVVIK